jgi:hypothetical protein
MRIDIILVVMIMHNRLKLVMVQGSFYTQPTLQNLFENHPFHILFNLLVNLIEAFHCSLLCPGKCPQ